LEGSSASPDLKTGITFAILNLVGQVPVASDWLKMCLRGGRISGITFFRRQEERPVMSGVFLFSSDFTHSRISASVTGVELMSKVNGDGGGSWGSGSVTG